MDYSDQEYQIAWVGSKSRSLYLIIHWPFLLDGLQLFTFLSKEDVNPPTKTIFRLLKIKGALRSDTGVKKLVSNSTGSENQLNRSQLGFKIKSYKLLFY